MTMESVIIWKFKMTPELVYLKRKAYQVHPSILKGSFSKSGFKFKKPFTSRNAPFNYSTTTVRSSSMLKD